MSCKCLQSTQLKFFQRHVMRTNMIEEEGSLLQFHPPIIPPALRSRSCLKPQSKQMCHHVSNRPFWGRCVFSYCCYRSLPLSYKSLLKSVTHPLQKWTSGPSPATERLKKVPSWFNFQEERAACLF